MISNDDIDSAAAIGHSTLVRLIFYGSPVHFLPELIVINLSSLVLKYDYLCKYIIEVIVSRRRQTSGEIRWEVRTESRSNNNESISDISLSKQRPYVFLLLFRRQMLA